MGGGFEDELEPEFRLASGLVAEVGETDCEGVDEYRDGLLQDFDGLLVFGGE